MAARQGSQTAADGAQLTVYSKALDQWKEGMQEFFAGEQQQQQQTIEGSSGGGAQVSVCEARAPRERACCL